MRLNRVELHARGYAGRHRASNEVGVQVELGGQQALAILVGLAHHQRGMGPAVEGLLERGLDEGALLLHHHDLVEAAREVMDDLALQRPHHAQLEDADAGALERAFAEPEAAQRVHQVVIGLAAGDDAQPCVAGALDPVHAVLARVGERQVRTDAQHRAFHVE